MNAPQIPREIPSCIAKNEPDAIFGWFSTRRLLVIKDGVTVSLSADDVRKLGMFVEGCTIEAQLS